LRPLPAFVCLTALLTASSDVAAAWPHDPAVNVPVSTAIFYQSFNSSIPDGFGGMFVAWIDGRSGSDQVYAQHLASDGTQLWTAGGVALTVVGTSKGFAAITTDGVGGVVVAWQDPRNGDYDIYAQRLNASGTPLWTGSGVRVTSAVGNQTDVSIAGDEAGGVFLAWIDSRNFGVSSYDVYAQHLDGAGNSLWTSGGVIVCDATGIQNTVGIVRDSFGIPVVAWIDQRTGVGDVFAQRLNGTGAGIWVANGYNVTTNASIQSEVRIVADAGGGTILVWSDYRNGNEDTYAQRLSFVPSKFWGASDLPVCTATNTQLTPVLVSDGELGAFIFWEDGRASPNDAVYGQHVVAGAAAWQTDGVLACDAIGLQTPLGVVRDGFGGAIVLWRDERTGIAHMYAQRIRQDGYSIWAPDGVQLSGAIGGQQLGGIAPDGKGGAFAVFSDIRSFGSYTDLYEQGVDRFGYLAPEPSIVSVKDVPNDQGGQVKLSWNPSPLDTDPLFYNINEYDIFRSVPTAAAQARARLGARVVPLEQFDASRDPGTLVTTTSGFWEYVGYEFARQLSGYSHVTPTTGDSVGGSNPRTRFMVRALGYSPSAGSVWWESAADSGYSVDNLAPAAPAPFTGQFAPGNVRLQWGPNSEPDLAGYRLYRGTDPGFAIGPGSLVAALSDTGYVDGTSQPAFYKLTAIDEHGNESPVAFLRPDGILDVPAMPATAFFARPQPNPMSASASMRFGLASAGHVRLEVLDAAGRLIRVLADASYPPGEFTLRWDGRDAAGRSVAPGLYFARFTGPSLSATRRIAFVP
jgi:hypothetical protein